MEEVIISLIDKLNSADALVALFIVAFIAVLKTPVDKMGKKTRAILTKGLLLAMAGSITVTFIFHIIDIFSQNGQ